MQASPSPFYLVPPKTRTCRQSCHQCTATLAGLEESVEAFFFSFLFCIFSPSPSFLLTPSCLAQCHGTKCPRICSIAVIFPIHMRCRTNSASAWRQSFFLPEIRPPGPGLLVRDSTRRVPCLFNVSTRPPAVAQDASIEIYLHASSAALHVLRNLWQPETGTGNGGWQAGYVCMCKKTGERGISLRPPS